MKKPKILKVAIEQRQDESPDMSWLGVYSDLGIGKNTEFIIDRNHTADCSRLWCYDDVPDDASKCGCPPCSSRECRFFIPTGVEAFNPEAEWILKEVRIAQSAGIQFLPKTYWLDTMRKQALQDYQRMESLQRGSWCLLGITAKAQVQLAGSDVVQQIHSGGLWGVESDGGDEYLKAVVDEQLADLKGQLLAIGCGPVAIARAFSNAVNVVPIEKHGGKMT